MTALRDIRRRIQSVINVKQITKAMEMVAAARLQKAQAKAEQSHLYSKKMQEIMDHLAASTTESNNPFFALRTVKKTGVVIIGGDKGLCGAYNSQIFNTADKFLKKYNSSNIELILLGRKAVSHYQHKPWKIRYQVKEWGNKFTYSQVRSLSNQLVKYFLEGQLDEIWLVYSQFISVLSRKVVVEKFLSLGKPKSQKIKMDYIFEPNSEELYAELLPRYCISKIQTVMDEAYASELAARVFSMRKATKNAEELIQKLTLGLNKVRQAGITREVIEIISGAEGLR